MRLHRLVASFFALAALLAAQVAPSAPQPARSGNLPKGPWETADILVVGELSGATLTASGARMRCKGLLRVSRVLKGAFGSGEQFPLDWEFTPSAPLNLRTSSSLPPQNGLWALERTAEGSVRPLPFPQFPPQGTALGEYLLLLPENPPSGSLAYRPDAPLETKVASELAAGLESIVLTAGDQVNLQWITPTSGGRVARITEPAGRFRALLSSLATLDYTAAGPAYSYLSNSPDANLRAAGLLGRMRGGDDEAALAFEYNAPQLAGTVAILELSQSILPVPWQDRLAAAHALARAALGETELRSLETAVAGRLPSTRRPEFLPYLAVMLESPDSGVRSAAIFGMCSLLRATPPPWGSPGGLRNDSIWEHCPQSSPRDAAEERPYLEFWKQWWASNREAIQADPAVPRPVVPTRYQVNAQLEDDRVQLPIEARFQILIGMVVSYQRMRRENPVADSAGLPFTGSIPQAKLTREDDAKLGEIALSVTTSLEATSERMRDASLKASMQGARPDQAFRATLVAERNKAIQKGLADMERELSPQGWKAVQDYLGTIGRGAKRVTLPPPPRPPTPR
jgi:hypothetical protein